MSLCFRCLGWDKIKIFFGSVFFSHWDWLCRNLRSLIQMKTSPKQTRIFRRIPPVHEIFGLEDAENVRKCRCMVWFPQNLEDSFLREKNMPWSLKIFSENFHWNILLNFCFITILSVKKRKNPNNQEIGEVNAALQCLVEFGALMEYRPLCVSLILYFAMWGLTVSETLILLLEFCKIS